jgi:hypothetical protein
MVPLANMIADVLPASRPEKKRKLDPNIANLHARAADARTQLWQKVTESFKKLFTDQLSEVLTISCTALQTNGEVEYVGGGKSLVNFNDLKDIVTIKHVSQHSAITDAVSEPALAVSAAIKELNVVSDLVFAIVRYVLVHKFEKLRAMQLGAAMLDRLDVDRTQIESMLKSVGITDEDTANFVNSFLKPLADIESDKLGSIWDGVKVMVGQCIDGSILSLSESDIGQVVGKLPKDTAFATFVKDFLSVPRPTLGCVWVCEKLGGWRVGGWLGCWLAGWFG